MAIKVVRVYEMPLRSDYRRKVKLERRLGKHGRQRKTGGCLNPIFFGIAGMSGISYYLAARRKFLPAVCFIPSHHASTPKDFRPS
jgi:hypothetical protein